jgi:proliferating cell nuclear antigen
MENNQTVTSEQEVKLQKATIITTVEDLKLLLQAPISLVDEATFSFTQDGIKARFMDPSHVAMMDINVPASSLKGYVLDGEPFKAAIRIDDAFNQVRKLFRDNKAIVTVVFDNESFMNESTGFMRVSTDKVKVNFRTMDASRSDTPLPKITFNASVDLTQEDIKTLKNIDFDYISFEVNKKHQYSVANSCKNVQLTYLTKSDSGDLEGNIQVNAYTSNVVETSRATFSLDYLKKMLQTVLNGKTNNARLEYSSKMPLKLSFNLSSRVAAKIDIYLAPRVQD